MRAAQRLLGALIVLWALLAPAGAQAARVLLQGNGNGNAYGLDNNSTDNGNAGTAPGQIKKGDQVINTRCPAGCASGSCVANSQGGFKCLKCVGRLVVLSADGSCGCPAGKYSKVAGDCEDCDKGSFCAGGMYTGVAGTPAQQGCGSGLTTNGKRSIGLRDCVNQPGYAYSVDAAGVPSVVQCPANTYSAGLKKQRACVPCAPGYTTNGRKGSSSSRACAVPAGYYLRGPGQVAACPQGEYQDGSGGAAAGCTPCALGVTTPSEGSLSEAACHVMLPGYAPITMTGGIVKASRLCPQKYWCPGGNATAAFSISSPLALAGTTLSLCPNGTWTESIGATSAFQCMTPPGFKTAGGATTECPDGTYRSEWKPATLAGNCSSCGVGIFSGTVDQINVYALDAASAANYTVLGVRSTSAGCYIKAGMGMLFSPSSGYRGVNCDKNNYGAMDTTYGLNPSPCRDCPVGTTASAALPNSGTHYFSDGQSPPNGGFTGPDACVTKVGYGWDGKQATKCMPGWWNPGDSLAPCTPCPYGTTTHDNSTAQSAEADCGAAPGFGFLADASSMAPCPMGYYNDEIRSTNSSCKVCPEGLTTSAQGALSVQDCNLCSPGYGGPGYGTACPAKCGGSAGATATYGQPTRDAGSACTECPTSTTGYFFDYLGENLAFVPVAVARAGADSPGDCLSEFAQIVDSVWYLGGAAPLTPVTANVTFEQCTDACRADAGCQYATYDYEAAETARCFKKVAAVNGSDVVAFKAVLSGDVTASKVGTKAKALASGSYTFWRDANATTIGTEAADGDATSVHACLSSCDNVVSCAAVVMTGITSADSTPTSCRLIFGDTTIASFKRSVTRAHVDRLSLSVLF